MPDEPKRVANVCVSSHAEANEGELGEGGWTHHLTEALRDTPYDLLCRAARHDPDPSTESGDEPEFLLVVLSPSFAQDDTCIAQVERFLSRFENRRDALHLREHVQSCSWLAVCIGAADPGDRLTQWVDVAKQHAVRTIPVQLPGYKQELLPGTLGFVTAVALRNQKGVEARFLDCVVAPLPGQLLCRKQKSAAPLLLRQRQGLSQDEQRFHDAEKVSDD